MLGSCRLRRCKLRRKGTRARPRCGGWSWCLLGCCGDSRAPLKVADTRKGVPFGTFGMYGLAILFCNALLFLNIGLARVLPHGCWGACRAAVRPRPCRGTGLGRRHHGVLGGGLHATQVRGAGLWPEPWWWCVVGGETRSPVPWGGPCAKAGDHAKSPFRLPAAPLVCAQRGAVSQSWSGSDAATLFGPQAQSLGHRWARSQPCGQAGRHRLCPTLAARRMPRGCVWRGALLSGGARLCRRGSGKSGRQMNCVRRRTGLGGGTS